MGALDGSPVVTFSGQGPLSRSTYVSEARVCGWQVVGTVDAGVDLLVVGTDHSQRKRLRALKLGIPVINYEQWAATVFTGEVSNSTNGID